MQQHADSSGTCAFFLAGPTAAGKTAVCQWIAEHQGYDVLSADSMLIYTGMDIGTGKPTTLERTRVRYLGIDLVDPSERFSVGTYCQFAQCAIDNVIASGRKLIITGGTGLYIKSLTDGLRAGAPVNMVIRLHAEQLLSEKGIIALRKLVKETDLDAYTAVIDKNNPRRLIRALERAASQDAQSIQRWKRGKASPRIHGLLLPLPQLYVRIEQRARAMYAGGLIEEVAHLLTSGFEKAPTASQAIGYAEVIHYLKRRCSLDEALAVTIRRTRRLAKRQLTWFRHQANVKWVEVDSSMSIVEMAQRVLECWRHDGPTPLVESL